MAGACELLVNNHAHTLASPTPAKLVKRMIKKEAEQINKKPIVNNKITYSRQELLNLNGKTSKKFSFANIPAEIAAANQQ